MCQFFSCISDGKGKVLFFKPEDIVKIMAEGNKKEYQWNSHTSIASFYGIEGKEEDKWNKWEYDIDKKILELDNGNKNDEKEVNKQIKQYLKDKDITYLRNLYNSNSGHRNSGHRNSGHSNSGDSNSGDRNSGNWNSGHRNSGHSNSGDSNSGHSNSGHSNSGNWNSGNWNSGNWNSGFFNTDIPKVRIFDKETDVKREDIEFPDYFYFNLTKWEEDGSICGGHLITLDYKQAWKESFNQAPLEDKEKTLELPNFDADKFLQITGIDILKELGRKEEAVKIGDYFYSKKEVEERLNGIKPIKGAN